MSSHPQQLNHDPERERLLDLLSQRATEGLNASEEAEVARLLVAHPDVDELGIELAAAAVTLALIDADDHAHEHLPYSVRQRALTLASAGPLSSRSSLAAATPAVSTGTNTTTGPSRLPRGLGSRTGWLAAAAALVIAAAGWWQAMAPASSRPNSPAAVVSEYQRFAATAPDVVRRAWVGKEPGFEGVRGQVVWSDQLQRGYMLFSGLRMNDAAREQYQLWIVDPTRDKNPVDGGVFSIVPGEAGTCTTGGEVVVRIDCKLPVRDPAAFALTVEKPGGVVVSAGPLVVVAAR